MRDEITFTLNSLVTTVKQEEKIKWEGRTTRSKERVKKLLSQAMIKQKGRITVEKNDNNN